MDTHGGKVYNYSIRIAPARVRTAGSVSHSEVSAVPNPIVPTPDTADNLKRCYRCSELKRRSEFALDRSRPDGLQIWCKACKREYRAENREAHNARDRQNYAKHRKERHARNRLYYAEHREEEVERSRRYRAEHRDELIAYDRQRRAEHGDLYRARVQRYNAVHSEQNVERARRWRLANPEKRKPHDHRRRARKAGAGGSYTSSDLSAIRAAQTNKRGWLICWACGKPIIGYPLINRARIARATCITCTRSAI